ncbi:HDOD domain-containing protein [Pseudoxanthomonas suwonensis]|uniref:HDOD domain-containing protein n=1 Tax=Pseudoxanthomonas suwonensis TaxID=314722 RepID=UPI0006973965|nr:HDOD domain-containing protein [Pseudoxanthomonas suwonensis]
MSLFPWIVLVLVVVGAVLGWRLRASRATRPSPMPIATPPSAVPASVGPDATREWALPLVELAALPCSSVSADVDADAGLRAAAARALAAFASEPQRLPRRPQLLPQLLGTLNDDEASGRQIAALIARDPALAATLLKLANSPLYRLQQAPVESVDRAVMLVGTEGLRRLVAVALMQPVMRTEGGVFGRLPGLVWEHTQHATVAAVRHAQVAGEDTFAAQLLVLLQGLGAIVVVQTLRDECQRAGGGAPQAATTADLLRQWSPRIGRLLAGQWQLSPRLLEALDDQARPETGAMGGLGRALAAAGAEAAERMRQEPVAG